MGEERGAYHPHIDGLGPEDVADRPRVERLRAERGRVRLEWRTEENDGRAWRHDRRGRTKRTEP
jgi:hypothetical protein